MYILGYTYYTHGTAAALLKDNKIVAAAEEERFNREKHTDKFPVSAVRYCLKEAGISVDEVDHIVFYMQPWVMLPYKILQVLKNFPRSLFLLDNQGGLRKFWGLVNAHNIFKRKLNVKNKKIRYYSFKHHENHAASTFFASSFEEAAILSMDGTGERTATWLGVGRKNRIERIKEIRYPHALGLLYAAFTDYLGYRSWSEEGKVMALASFGKPVYNELFQKIVKLEPCGGYSFDMSYFGYHITGWKDFLKPKTLKILGPKRKPGGPILQRHKDIAASLQESLEFTAVHIIKYLHEIVQSENLCLAGGVALNIAMNWKLLKNSPFENIYIQPAANEAGTSLGGALYCYHQRLNGPRSDGMKDAFLGPGYGQNKIEAALKKYRIDYRHCRDIAAESAALIASGKIVGWFQGRMEFGPRALGHRSILADPRNGKIKDMINKKVKQREAFRPYAPAVLYEKAGAYFETGIRSPFMLLAVKVKSDKKDVIPGVTHIDGTARYQTVDRGSNLLFYELIREFEKLTGVPVVLNTSFNSRGEPIVCSPGDAVRCFLNTGMDYLAIGNCLACKS